MSIVRRMDKDVLCVYTMEYYSHKSEIMPFAATRMDLQIVHKGSKSDKDKYHSMSLICGI